jgi:hypothetical protein
MPASNDMGNGFYSRCQPEVLHLSMENTSVGNLKYRIGQPCCTPIFITSTNKRSYSFALIQCHFDLFRRKGQKKRTKRK